MIFVLPFLKRPYDAWSGRNFECRLSAEVVSNLISPPQLQTPLSQRVILQFQNAMTAAVDDTRVRFFHHRYSVIIIILVYKIYNIITIIAIGNIINTDVASEKP